MELTCRRCDKVAEIEIDTDRYQAWKDGALIQNVFPELSADERELLISGWCGSCFDDLFK